MITPSPNSQTGNCSWIDLVCQAKATTPCSCTSLPPSDCNFGQKRDVTIAPACTRGQYGNCVLQSTCIVDTCGGLGTPVCGCNYSACLFVTSASGTYEGCFAPNSDTFRMLVNYPNVTVSGVLPANCTQTAPAAPAPAPSSNCTSCQQATIIQNCRNTISGTDQINSAMTAFNQNQSDVRNSIDNETGTYLGRHFSLSSTVCATPTLRPDNSMDLSVVVNFIPNENVLTPTKDHQRVFCPCVKKLVTTLGKFQDSEAANSDCTWNSFDAGQNQASTGNSQNNTLNVQKSKRGLLQSETSGNSYLVSVNFPAAAVNRVYSGSGPGTTNANFGIVSQCGLMLLLAAMVAASLLGL